MLSRGSQKLAISLMTIMVICLVNSSTSVEINGILLLDETSFDKAIGEFEHLLVYFSSKQCGYCGEFDVTFAVLEERHRSRNSDAKSKEESQETLTIDQNEIHKGPKYLGLHFAKILYENNTGLFEKYKIDAVPTLRMFRGAKIMPYEYESVEYNEEALPYAEQWIERLVKSEIPIWEYRDTTQTEDSFAVTVLVPCDSIFIEKLKEAHKKDAFNYFYCTNKKEVLSAKNKLAIKGPEDKQFTQYEVESDLQTELESRINYHLKVQKWSNATIRDLFSNNKSMYVLLVNNDPHSDSMVRIYRKIRQESIDIAESFVCANLHEDIQGVSKLKQYIGFPLQPVYPFPMLTYITHKEGRIAKYMFGSVKEAEEKLVKNSEGEFFNKSQVAAWMLRARNGQQKEHFRSNDLHPIEQFIDYPIGEAERITLVDFNYMLSDAYKQQFAVYVEWRNDHLSNFIEDSILKRWDKQRLSKEINIYLFALNMNDLPPRLQTKITKVPSVVYIDKDKNFQILEDIASYEADLIPFLERYVKPYRRTWYYELPEHKNQLKLLEADSQTDIPSNKPRQEETVDTLQPLPGPNKQSRKKQNMEETPLVQK